MRIANMTAPTRDPWLTTIPWQIVRSDVDLAHVFIPLSSFKFVKSGNGYTIDYTNQPPHPDVFGDTVLRPAGTRPAVFEKIAERTKKMPAYGKSSAKVYADISDKIATYLDADSEIERLEGVIRVPCHAHGATVHSQAVAGHQAFWMKTHIHIYHFGNVVEGDHSFLLLRAPLSPLCPTNSDGTAVGIA
jgi:hypothetical protein